MGKLTRSELDELLASPEIAVLSTVDAEGRPEGTPIWYEYADSKIRLHVGRASKKARNLRANPHACVTLDTRVPPYKGAVLRGRASIDEPDAALRRRIAVRYLGEELGEAYLAATEAEHAQSVRIEIPIESRSTWDYSKDFGSI